MYKRQGGIGDVQIPDLLVVVQIGALDGVGRADAVCLVLVVDGQVCQMGLEAVSYTHLRAA